ncbi:MAG: hypothetical protein QM504_03825 [Pseudomonadota bacterium]
MNLSLILSVIVITVVSFNSNIAVAELMVFPAKGQSDKQIEQDKYSCYGWAKKQSGFDPMGVPKASTPAPSQQKKSGGLVRGGIGGAILGGIVDGSKGAKRGAAAGGLIGGVRQGSANSRAEQQTAQWEQQEANKYANNRSKYDRAYSACLEGKGYTVK